MEESMAVDWLGLVFELLVEIANRVISLEDFMAFRGVCSYWREAGNSGSRRSMPAGAPLIMLAEKEDSDDREFYSLSKKKISMRLFLLEAKGRRCVEAKFGWLLTQTNSGEVNLLNPFSRKQIKLPDLDEDYYPRAMLSANPSDSLDFKLYVVVGVDEDSDLGFWRPGDENWTWIRSRSLTENMCYYNQKLYVVDGDGSIMVLDPFDDDHVWKEIVTIDFGIVGCKTLYLVESSLCPGELLLITRLCVEEEGGTFTYLFEVVRIDVAKREWEVIGDLKREVVFVGWSAAVSVPPVDDVIKPNCIYFTDDNLEEDNGKDMGVYDFAEGSYDPKDAIERFSIESLSLVSPPVWIDGSIFFPKN